MALFGLGYKKIIEEIKQYLNAEEYDKAALCADKVPIHR